MTGAGSVHVRMVLADYATGDPQGKLHIVGGGISILGPDPVSGTTPPFALAVIVTFDPQIVGQTPAIDIQLEDESGKQVIVPQGADGALAPLVFHVKTTLSPPPPRVHGAEVPIDAVRAKSQAVINFNTGLKLDPGRYTWRVIVDEITRDEWTEWMYVTGRPNP